MTENPRENSSYAPEMFFFHFEYFIFFVANMCVAFGRIKILT